MGELRGKVMGGQAPGGGLRLKQSSLGWPGSLNCR
jgi:hypothetical protein